MKARQRRPQRHRLRHLTSRRSGGNGCADPRFSPELETGGHGERAGLVPGSRGNRPGGDGGTARAGATTRGIRTSRNSRSQPQPQQPAFWLPPPDPRRDLADERRPGCGRSGRSPRLFVAKVASGLLSLAGLRFGHRRRPACGGHRHHRPDSSVNGWQILNMPVSIVLVLGFVGVIIWAYKAATVASKLNYPARHSTTWAILGWIVPVINFWFPYQSVRDCLAPGQPRAPDSQSMVGAVPRRLVRLGRRRRRRGRRGLAIALGTGAARHRGQRPRAAGRAPRRRRRRSRSRRSHRPDRHDTVTGVPPSAADR